MAKGDLLIELRCEEIPADLLAETAEQLEERVASELRLAELDPSKVRSSFTPRRLYVHVKGLPLEVTSGQEEVVYGPTVRTAFDDREEPTAGLRRFLEEHGAEVEELEREPRGRSEVVLLRKPAASSPTSEILAELIPRVVLQMSFSRTLRWRPGAEPWLVPLRGLLVLFDGELVPCRVLGVEASNATVGHPVLSRRPFKVRDAADYRRKLATRSIEVDFRSRRRALSERLRKRAQELGGKLVDDPPLVDWLASSCEIPGVVDGRIGLEFLTLPRELVTLCLRERQRALGVEGNGNLLPFFLVMMDRPNDPAGRVRTGNEAAVAGALADVRFLYLQDREVPLARRYRELESKRVPAEPGTYAEKVERLGELSRFLCSELGLEKERDQAVEAVSLLKADRTSLLAGEFPRHRGLIGGLLAREEGYPETIWQAISDHLPGPGRPEVPRSPVGRVVALADRIDTLVARFGGGQAEEAERSARELAESVVRILIGGELDLDLDLVAARAARLFGEHLVRGGEEIVGSLRPFFDESLRAVLVDDGFANDEIEAVLGSGDTASLPQVRRRIGAIRDLRSDERFPTVAQTARRLVEVLREAPEQDLDATLLVEEGEKDLFVVLQKLREEVDQCLGEGKYRPWLRHLTELSSATERFLAEVLVRDENERLRHNRLALLQAVHRVFSRRVRWGVLEVEE